MIIETVTPYRFAEVMARHDFSYEGSLALFEYLENLSDDTGQPIEFDPIGIRYDFNEYPSVEEAAADYGVTPDDLEVVAEGDGFVIVRNL